LDLVGGPFAVIKSDPGKPLNCILTHYSYSCMQVFSHPQHVNSESRTSRSSKYTEPCAVDHLHPYGLVFCFCWRKDTHRPTNFKDPAAEHVWFANQLSDDACASQAILNILFNCSNINIGKELSANNTLATAILNAAKKEKEKMKQDHNPPPNKCAKTKKPPLKEGDKEIYHFISYIPAYGKVWELDGLKSGPLEVGDVMAMTEWMDIVQPALRTKMHKYGGGGDNGGHDIQFSLLAIVDDAYEKASNE
ncbi:cysteine proteinase, partial [Armillaria gallica]